MPYNVRFEEKNSIRQAWKDGIRVDGRLRWKSLTYWLRAARVAQGITQRDLATMSGIARTQISMIETGAVDPQLSTVYRLFDAMGCRLLTLPMCPPGYIRSSRGGVSRLEIWQRQRRQRARARAAGYV